MKSLHPTARRHEGLSRPVRGAWIEMYRGDLVCWLAASRPVRGAWIEMAMDTS